MKAKDVFMILMVSTCFWSMIVTVTYYIGEYHGREGVEAKTIAKTDTLYIRKERICEQDCYTGAVECQEFTQPVRAAQ